MSPAPPRYNSRYRLRALFGIICILSLPLPLAAFYAFRFYENELVTETELELISQGAVLATHYRQKLQRVVPDPYEYGRPLPDNYEQHVINDFYTPIYPQIDLSHSKVLPVRPDPKATVQPADPFAATIGVSYSETLSEVQRTTLSGLLVLDYNGIIVAGPRSTGDSFAHTEEIRQALNSGHYTSVLRQRDTGEELPWYISLFSRSTGVRIFAAYPVIENNRVWGVIYLSRTPQNILKQLHAERECLMLLGAAYLALVIGALIFVWYHVNRPLRALIHKAQHAAEGDAEAMAPLKRPGLREMETLSRHLSRLAHALHQRTRYIRDFAGLATQAFKGYTQKIGHETDRAIEQLDRMDKVEMRNALQAISHNNKQMDHLMAQLLEFSLAENHIPLPGTSYIMPILTRMQEYYRQHGLELQLHGEGHCDVIMPADTFESIMKQMLDNTLLHGAKTAQIDLQLDEEYVTLRIADDGRGITESGQARIFEPFYTTGKDEGWTGLGLPIAKALADAYDGTLVLEPSKKGAVFLLTLPVVH